ncbi:hypothetical protein ABIE33_003037 [Ensifer sp. 4252]
MCVLRPCKQVALARHIHVVGLNRVPVLSHRIDLSTDDRLPSGGVVASAPNAHVAIECYLLGDRSHYRKITRVLELYLVGFVSFEPDINHSSDCLKAVWLRRPYSAFKLLERSVHYILAKLLKLLSIVELLASAPGTTFSEKADQVASTPFDDGSVIGRSACASELRLKFQFDEIQMISVRGSDLLHDEENRNDGSETGKPAAQCAYPFTETVHIIFSAYDDLVCGREAKVCDKRSYNQEWPQPVPKIRRLHISRHVLTSHRRRVNSVWLVPSVLDGAHEKKKLSVEGFTVGSRMNASVAVRTKPNDKPRVVRAAIAKPSNVVWLEIGNSVRPKERSRLTAPLTIALRSSDNVVAHIAATLKHSGNGLSLARRGICRGESALAKLGEVQIHGSVALNYFNYGGDRPEFENNGIAHFACLVRRALNVVPLANIFVLEAKAVLRFAEEQEARAIPRMVGDPSVSPFRSCGNGAGSCACRAGENCKAGAEPPLL